MTTREFINNNYGYQPSKVTYCSSVMQDTRGNFYSYGYHYPLLFKLDGKTIRNVRGYSNTTAKHINWTRDIYAIDIEVPSTFRLNSYDSEQELINQLAKGQKEYINSIVKQMDAKKRKDTQVYEYLDRDLRRAVENLRELTE